MAFLTKENWAERKEFWLPQGDDAREYYDIDYARIIHSASFRRLQGKTQVFTLGASDFYRNRLTHSIEVSQIAGGIVQQLKKRVDDEPQFDDELRPVWPPSNLIAAIAAAHDLGHPPFGHGGEVALNYCMKDRGGFEGNGQTLRILSRLEYYSDKVGANLARRTLLGCLKYPVEFSKVENKGIKPRLIDDASMPILIDREISKPPKCYLKTEKDIVEWILDPLSKKDKKTFQEIKKIKGKHSKARHCSLDCSIMDLADEISYGVHDFEDAIVLGFLNKEDFKSYCKKSDCYDFIKSLRMRYPNEVVNYDNLVDNFFSSNPDRYGPNARRHVRRLIHYFLTKIDIDIEYINDFTEPLLKYRVKLEEEAEQLLDSLGKLIKEEVVFKAAVQQLEFKGQRMVIEVFNILESDPEKYLRKDYAERLKKKSDTPERIICDYIAGMTDDYLLKTYERLSSPRMGSVFDKL